MKMDPLSIFGRMLVYLKCTLELIIRDQTIGFLQPNPVQNIASNSLDSTFQSISVNEILAFPVLLIDSGACFGKQADSHINAMSLLSLVDDHVTAVTGKEVADHVTAVTGKEVADHVTAVTGKEVVDRVWEEEKSRRMTVSIEPLVNLEKSWGKLPLASGSVFCGI